jgi:hypothetical protein
MDRRQLIVAILLVSAAVSGNTASAGKDAQCVRLESRIADLRLKLRLGYSARQGRVFRQKLATLENERRRLCR